MTKLEQAINKVKSLPEATQDQVADLLLSFTDKQSVFVFTPEESAELDRRSVSIKGARSIEDIFELTEAELTELDDRLLNDNEVLSMEEVFAPLREKYGLRNVA